MYIYSKQKKKKKSFISFHWIQGIWNFVHQPLPDRQIHKQNRPLSTQRPSTRQSDTGRKSPELCQCIVKPVFHRCSMLQPKGQAYGSQILEKIHQNFVSVLLNLCSMDAQCSLHYVAVTWYSYSWKRNTKYPPPPQISREKQWRCQEIKWTSNDSPKTVYTNFFYLVSWKNLDYPAKVTIYMAKHWYKWNKSQNTFTAFNQIKQLYPETSHAVYLLCGHIIHDLCVVMIKLAHRKTWQWPFHIIHNHLLK